MKRKVTIVVIISACLIVLCLSMALSKKKAGFDHSWFDNEKYIAHGLGGYNGLAQTNSLEAFQYNLDRGFKIFEVDFNLTMDNQLIASHDEQMWNVFIENKEAEYTYDIFCNTTLSNGSHTLDSKGIASLINANQGIYMIIDWGNVPKEELLMRYTIFVDHASEISADVLERCIPELVDEVTYETIFGTYSFKDAIFVYDPERWENIEEAVDFCIRKNIKYVSLPKWATQREILGQWIKSGFEVLVYSINDPDEARGLFDRGIRGVYTDWLFDD